MMFHAEPQTRGRISHEAIDHKTYSNRANDIISLPVYSEKYGLMGKTDLYKQKEHFLIERKYQLNYDYYTTYREMPQIWSSTHCR